MAKPTIANVAQLAGVSQATVSRALRGATNVTEATRNKVRQAADQLNFTLSKSASALASGKTMRVILLVSGKLNEWFNSGVLQGVYEELAPFGYDVTPAFITDRSEAATRTPSSSPHSSSCPPCGSSSKPSTCQR